MAFGADSISLVTQGYRRDSGGLEDRILTQGLYGDITSASVGVIAKIKNWLKKKRLR